VAGHSHLFDLVSDDRFEVAAVCSRSPQRAAQTADLFDVPAAYSNPGLMLEREDLQGLVIAVPPAAAADLLHLALSAGLVVLVDKPAAGRPEQLRRLLHGRLADAVPRAVVGYNRRYRSHVREARAMVAPTLPDSVSRVDCCWSGPFDHRYNNGQTYRRHVGFGDGVLLDTVSHVFDTLAFLGFEAPTVEHARLIAGASGADIAAELRLSWGDVKMPITIAIRDSTEEAWNIAIQGPGGHFVFGKSDMRGTWFQRNIQVLGNDLHRPVDDLMELANDRLPRGANLAEAAAVLETIQQARLAADALRPAWKRPRAKALGRLNGAC
jgi:predicted dehydrogenase